MSVSSIVLDGVATVGPALVAVGGAGVVAGATLWGIQRGFEFFRNLSSGGADLASYYSGGESDEAEETESWR